MKNESIKFDMFGQWIYLFSQTENNSVDWRKDYTKSHKTTIPLLVATGITKFENPW